MAKGLLSLSDICGVTCASCDSETFPFQTVEGGCEWNGGFPARILGLGNDSVAKLARGPPTRRKTHRALQSQTPREIRKKPQGQSQILTIVWQIYIYF